MAKSKSKKSSASTSVVPHKGHQVTSGKHKATRSANGQAQARTLLSGSIPRPRMRMSGDSTTLRVSGLEVINEVLVSSTAITAKLDLNPALNFLFPRLSGIASQFERYRFRKVRLNFHTACPATRSGAVGLMVSTEFLSSDSVPGNFLDMAAFQNSAVGTVAENFSTPWWVCENAGAKWYIPNGSIADGDPLVVFQGTLGFLTRDAIPADTGLIGGYVSVEYDVELFGWRPSRNRCLNAATAAGTSVTGPAVQLINLDPGKNQQGILNSVGNWALEKAANYITTLTGVDLTKWCIGDVPDSQSYTVSYNTTLQALGASLDAWEEVETKVPARPPGVARARAAVGDSRIHYYNPRLVKNPPSYAIPLEYDEKTRTYFAPSAPAAAGDIQIRCSSIDADTQVDTPVFWDTFSLGTGLITVEGTEIFTPDPGHDCLVFRLNVLTSGETRVINPGDFRYSLVGAGAGA